ncbi:MAG: hypothetical protein ACL93V_04325 [Candidatus Electrothrix sp. YB6]
MSLNRRLAAFDPNAVTIKQHAELGTLPPFLGVKELAELWAEGTTFPQENYVKLLKQDIEDGELACITIGQWIALSQEWGKLSSPARPPKITPPPNLNAINHGVDCKFSVLVMSEADLVPQDRIGGHLGDTSEMSFLDKNMAPRLYKVNRSEFKKWLLKNDEWPLPDECLLARWWDNDEGDEDANTLQATATKQQEKPIQELINRVLQANPEAKNVEIWNTLKNYDADGIIEEQEPKRIETIVGNEEAYIRYVHPVRGTVYNPIKLKAFQERCTRARKELGISGKS